MIMIMTMMSMLMKRIKMGINYKDLTNKCRVGSSIFTNWDRTIANCLNHELSIIYTISD